ncbi:thiazolylpeptide-type bacteriocin [Deinococcus arcticus]|uniref:Thiazolylpeptide-type bacteriocin n=1 Tax=Deinococcus arcticus TaxID=2136176 RepID=A0A2T3W501_9DEIO|nr:thiazolylpeptide-type bacteriocin [Deinococcus arcticus]PTA66970.1 thiazolylpeptide-type bacteriocin [Deinococcus arcticus]
MTINTPMTDIDFSDLNIEALEVTEVRDSTALAETGASSGSSSCSATSTCGSSSCCCGSVEVVAE